METTGSVGAATLKKGVLTLNYLHAANLKFSDQTFLQYGLTNRLQVGLGYLWQRGGPKGPGDVWRPLANYALITEKRDRPSFTAGLMYDSLQAGREGFFLSLGKSLPKALPKSLSVYAGTAKITSEARWRFVAGGNLKLARGINVSVQYNGVDPTYGIAFRLGSIRKTPVHFSLLAVNGNSFGVEGAMRVKLVPDKHE